MKSEPILDEIQEAMSTREFPMQGGPSIPWSLAEQIYERYAAKQGRSQSLERLAERGGFGWAEVEYIWNGHKENTNNVLRKRIKELEERFINED